MSTLEPSTDEFVRAYQTFLHTLFARFPLLQYELIDHSDKRQGFGSFLCSLVTTRYK